MAYATVQWGTYFGFSLAEMQAEQARAKAAVKATNRPYRVLAPDSMATQDFSPDRINLNTDAAGIVTSVTCQ